MLHCRHETEITIKALLHYCGFCFRISWVNKIMISSAHEAFYIVSQLWQAEPYVAKILYRRTSSLVMQLPSLPSICQAPSVSSIWDWEQTNTVVPPQRLWNTASLHKLHTHTQAWLKNQPATPGEVLFSSLRYWHRRHTRLLISSRPAS